MTTPADFAFANVDATTMNQFTRTPTTDTFGALQTKINQAETTELERSITNANSSATALLTYGGLLSRNTALDGIARDLTAENQKVARGGADTFSRQTEINQWQAENKMDTLFFLQIGFLYFALIVILLYFRQMGILPNAVFYMIVVIGLLIVIGVLLNRSSYTKLSRDNRYWNRRYIGLGDSGDLSAKLQCSLSAT